MFLVAAARRVALLEARSSSGALVPVDGDRRDRVPVHRRDRRLDPDRDGPPAVDRAGAAADRARRTRRASARRGSGSASASSSRSTSSLGVVDFVLMRRYARPDRPAPREELPAPAVTLLMNLQILWFCLIAFLWSGYFLLEGFDFGVGMLLPFLPRDERERGAMLRDDRPGLGRQRGLARRRRRRDLRRLPGLVRDDVLGLLPRAAARPLLPDRPRRLVRVARRRARARAGGRVWLWANAVGSFGHRRSSGASRSPNLLHGVPIDSNGDFTGNLWDLFSAYTVLGGIAFVLLFAFHGATFLTLRTTGDLCERARRGRAAARRPGGRRRRRLPDLDGRRRGRPERQGRLPAGPAGGDRDRGARARGGLSSAAGRSGLAFAIDGVGTRAPSVATLFTSLYPRVMVSSPTSRNSLTVAERRVRALHARGDDASSP